MSNDFVSFFLFIIFILIATNFEIEKNKLFLWFLRYFKEIKPFFREILFTKKTVVFLYILCYNLML